MRDIMEKLQQYKKIGWDFDGTLYGHDSSPAIWDFISTNPYGQEHYIVTHRSHGLEKQMFWQLESIGSHLSAGDFVDIFNVSDTMFEIYSNAKSIIMPEDLANDPYVEWKGLTCFQHGIEVMVDDDPSMVIPGCQKHGIAFIDVDDLQ